MKKTLLLTAAAVAACAFAACDRTSPSQARNLERAKATLDSVYASYGVADRCLLRENYPFNADYKAGYLASEDQARPNPYSYLWPFSGTLSAVNTILEEDASYRSVLDGRVLPGLAEYLDTTRMPAAYASYINTAPASDRFYDDNVWLGIDFCDIYEATGDKKYLAQAEMIWKFIESGMDDVLGGGIYWCEQHKDSKNTCSNAPAAVYALKLYAATGERHYLEQGKALYAWTKRYLSDPGDGLYYDNMALDGTLVKTKYSCNSGQMVQAGALLHKATGDESYLKDAQRTAAASYGCFFTGFTPEDGTPFRILGKGDVWFSAVMTRGFIELYRIDGNAEYLEAVQRSLDHAWVHARDGKGLFGADLTGREKDSRKWLLTQAGMAEMYARMANLNLK